MSVFGVTQDAIVTKPEQHNGNGIFYFAFIFFHHQLHHYIRVWVCVGGGVGVVGLLVLWGLILVPRGFLLRESLYLPQSPSPMVQWGGLGPAAKGFLHLCQSPSPLVLLSDLGIAGLMVVLLPGRPLLWLRI
ncbi:hypothetical protein U1Q18_042744, partial [Sarracenia purpurea var. burkii]